jgi:ribonuclease H2 subunit A
MDTSYVCSWPRVFIPDDCRDVEIVIGIDEAGRGPVLGSMIYAAAFWPRSQHEAICKLGFDDSKQLKEGVRDGLFEKIRSHGSIGWVIDEIPATAISADMLKPQPISLNAISYRAVIRILEIIRDTDRAPTINEIFIDTVGDPEYYKSTLTKALGTDFATFTIEKKADATYRVVSAASIVAKVTRDTLMKEYKWVEPSVSLQTNYGSGYPGDEHCVKWLEAAQQRVFGFPNLVRFSWSTSRDALEKGIACDVKWECDEDESLGVGPGITSFFGAGANKRPRRSAYFTKRKLRHLKSTEFY